MKIAIIGAGAMGSLFGGLLTLAGEEVWLLDICDDQIHTIREKGVVICSENGDLNARPNATTKPQDVGLVDLIIIFVKSIATSVVAKTALGLLTPDTMVLTLQNGYGNAEKSQVQHMVKLLLKLDDKPKTDEADALAVAICHANSRRGYKL